MDRDAVKPVGIDDLFFSTTDQRGVIQLANALFVRIANYERDRLIGAPHSIIRHPHMPGAVFHLMWRTLEAGQPFVGYVHNRASDGSTYTVCALVTPLPSGGYLSVRVGTSQLELLQQVDDVYRAIRIYEADLIAEGLSRREAARLGAERLGETIAAAGFASYERLQQHILSEELKAHGPLRAGLPTRPMARSGFAQLLPTISAIGAELEAWLTDVDSLATLSDALSDSAIRLRSELADVSGTAARITEVATGSPKLEAPLASLVLWTQMQAIVQGHVSDLIESLERLDDLTRETRLRLGFAHLFTRMNAKFAAELIDTMEQGTAASERESGPALNAMSKIAESLQHQLTEMNRLSVEHRSMTKRTADYISRTSELMQLPRELLRLWHSDVDTSSIPTEAADLVAEIGRSMDQADSAIAALTQTTERCRSFGDGHSASALDKQVASFRALTTELTATHG